MGKKFIENLDSRMLKYSIAAGAVLLGTSEANAQVWGQSVNQSIANSSYTINFNGNNKFIINQKFNKIINPPNIMRTPLGNTMRIPGSSFTTNTGLIKPLSNNAGWIKPNTNTKPNALSSNYIVGSGKSFKIPGNTSSLKFFHWKNMNGAKQSSSGADFIGKGDKYIGVKFQLTDGTHYGWIKINVANQGSSIQILSYAYEQTAGNSITANGTLPVELTTFTAHKGGDKVELNWETATEVNNYGFDIVRNKYPDFSNGKKQSVSQWEKIGFVKGNGNSNSLKEYSYTDGTPPNGLVMYRLKQIDNNGGFKYSNIITINLTPSRFELFQNYPNPFNPTTTIQYAIPKAEHVTLKVYDELGKEVSTLVNENKEAGQYRVNFNGSNFASGIYYYRITAGDFTEVKKLMLLR